MHDLPLLVNIAVALSAALVGGLLARRAGVPPLVGYLLAGVAIGPFTPGFVGDITAIAQLAELGVVFLMFGVGLHFSLRDLWRVRAVAVPGALGQMALATLLAYGLARFWGWSTEASLVLGLAISVASTVVLLRGLMDDGLLNTGPGSLAVGWLVLEDLATVLLLLVLPAWPPTRSRLRCRGPGPHPRQGRRLHRAHAGPGGAGRALRPPSGGPHALARAVPSRGPDRGPRNRPRLGRALRGVARPGGVSRRGWW